MTLHTEHVPIAVCFQFQHNTNYHLLVYFVPKKFVVIVYMFEFVNNVKNVYCIYIIHIVLECIRNMTSVFV